MYWECGSGHSQGLVVVQKTSIFATSTWFVMVTLKHPQLCGMFTVAVCDTCNKYENMDRQSAEYKKWRESDSYLKWKTEDKTAICN
jgi:ABC-type transport system involved in Fe-S cluster assembly fused permease/ATPase subunit